MARLRKIYDIKYDPERIAMIQKASAETKEYGFIPTNGLFGTPTWWKAIEDGTVASHISEGTITRVFMSGHNDWPEFELSDGHEQARWTREGDAKAYIEGASVRIVYIIQQAKRSW